MPEGGDIVVREQQRELIAPLQRQDAGERVEVMGAFELAIGGDRVGEGLNDASGGVDQGRCRVTIVGLE